MYLLPLDRHHTHLPVELYSSIISHLPSPYQRSTLYTLATSFKALSKVAIRELYRSVECGDRHALRLFSRRVVLDEGSRGTKALVKELTLHLGHSEPLEVVHWMRDALLSLHNLQMLSIRDSEGPPGPTSPVSTIVQMGEQARFKLTYISLKIFFRYNVDFERFLERHCETLQMLELWDPSPGSPEAVADKPLNNFTAMDAIAIPGSYIARFLKHSQPTKIWDIDGSLKYHEIPTGDRRKVTSFRGCKCSSIDQFTLNTFGPSLRYLRLQVEIDKEVMISIGDVLPLVTCIS